MKYGNWTLGQTEALLNLLGGEDEALAVLRGEKALLIKALGIKLFDKNGRRIPSKDLQNAVCDSDKNFYLVQPQFNTGEDFTARFVRFREVFHPGPMSVTNFEDKTKELLDEIKSNKNLANLLNGVHLPIILPKIKAHNFDYGRTLEQILLKAAGSSYEKQFPSRRFQNWRKGKLTNQVKIVEGSRHEKLIAKMKVGIVCAIYFPNPLQGFSLFASREQMKDLPETLLLSGGFDTAVAMVMYPDILGRDYNTPGYDSSALQWQSLFHSLCFLAYDDRLCFDDRAFLGDALRHYSSGFLFLGSA